MTGRGLSLLRFHKRLLLLAAGCCAVALQALGQASAVATQDVGAKAIVYDTVSVHPCKTGSEMSISVHPDGFSAGCTTLWGLLFNAFDVRPNDPMPGLPGWASSAQFDVEAKMDADTLAALQKLPRDESGEQRQRMLQAILADRFKLTIHHETRERPTYGLVIAKGGPNLMPGDDKNGSGTS